MRTIIHRSWFLLLILTGFVLLPIRLAASDDQADSDAFQFFQEEAKVAIATQREQTPEEAPSIVSVITRADIERYGARDLADIMRMVPGFELSSDIISLVGLTSRGIAVNEGKVLVMINGVTQNELGYGNINLIGSIPASTIEKVEIVRGPGSALYGGFAEVAVINVITQEAGDLNGLRLTGDVGIGAGGSVSRYGSASYGSQTDTMRVAGNVAYGSTVLSRSDYTDFYGNRLSLNSDTAYRRWQDVTTEASSKGLTIRYQRTSFAWGAQDGIAVIDQPVNGILLDQINMFNDTTHVDYVAKISDHLTLLPVFEYYRDNSESFDYSAAPDAFYNNSSLMLWQYRAELTALYKASDSTQARFGGGYIRDEIGDVGVDGSPGLQLSSDPSDVTSRAHDTSTYGLLQVEQQFRSIGFTVGGRYEDNRFGTDFAPRAGLTYVHEAFNAKLLYGRAFRNPTLWEAYGRSTNDNPDLKPETADTTELEAGYKLSPHVKGSWNLFYIDIKDPIQYMGNVNEYLNLGRLQSEGTEAEIRADYPHYGGVANVAFAMPGRDTSPEFVTESKKQFLASPPIKMSAGAYYRSGMFEYGPSVTYLSRRAGQSETSAQDISGINQETTDYAALFLFDMNITARNVFKSVDIHFGVRNIFDTRYVLIQPYYGDHAPLPANTREIDLGVTWHI